MPSGVRVSPTAPPFAFDVLDCESAGATPARPRWRLHGRTADGRRLLLDVEADAAPGVGAAALPPRLTRATVAPASHDPAGSLASTPGGPRTRVDLDTAGESRRQGWVIQSEQGRFDLGAVRLFVHEDVSAQAAIAVPPRAVPLGKRLFWRAVFALLATRAGRRWLERRAAA